MRINVFEGSRRISVLVATLYALGVGAYYVGNIPEVHITYQVDYPGEMPKTLVNDSCSYNDASKSQMRTTPSGSKYELTLCFRPRKFTSGEYIPYKIEGDSIWGESEFSEEVTAYTARAIANFKSSERAIEEVESRVWPTRKKHFQEGLTIILVGLGVFWVFVATVGWIVRGFLRIPRGRDSRAEG
jgi:hypothetical protein